MQKKGRKAKQPAIRLPRRVRNAKGNPKIAEHGRPHQFKLGASGNPSGRPIDLVSKAARQLMPQRCPYDRDGRTWAEAIALALGRRAVRGDVQAARELGDRTEGKPVQGLRISGALDVTHAEVDAQIKLFTERIRARKSAETAAVQHVH
jgi:hypothetical protein